MKVVVTGATGFVGQEVIRQLLADGHQAVAIVRNPESRAARRLLARGRVECRQGDVVQNTLPQSAFEGADAVIHLVGIISEIGENTFDNVHWHGTEHVLKATRDAGVGRYLQMSALGTRKSAVARYHQTKWLAEEAVRSCDGLQFTIFRPSMIYGPQDQVVNLFASISRFSPVLPLFGGGTSQIQPIAVEDVARSFVRSLSRPESIGQTLDLCGEDAMTFKAFLQTILEVLHRRRLLLPIPMAVARIQAAFLEAVFPTLLKKAPPLNRDQLIMLGEDNTGDPGPMKSSFDIQPQPFRSGIQMFLVNENHR